MKQDDSYPVTGRGANPAPITLEGFAILHQFFRIRHREWNLRSSEEQVRAMSQAAEMFAALTRREDGGSAFFAQLGHKGDLIAIHFRRNLDELAEVERAVAGLALSESLEASTSYLSIIEIGLYEATLRLHSELTARGIKPHSLQWHEAIEHDLAAQREKLAPRLWPSIPPRRYICFYPMNKRRVGQDNWYSLPLAERQRLMHDHGLIGRRYAGQVNQIISGSIGLDDWEWGVDLFADDPMVFKKLVYEMRFDESSARYAEFGPFHVGIRLAPDELPHLMGVTAFERV